MLALIANKIVLIIGQSPDAHIEAISSGLERRGIRTLCVNRYGGDYLSASYIGDKVKGWLDIADSRIEFDQIASVWWRLKPARAVEFSGGKGTEGERFRWTEWQQLLGSLPQLLPEAVWFNDPVAHATSARKSSQLAVAQSCGIVVPDTIISNDHSAVLQLFDRHERVIYKTLSSYLIPPDEIIYTNEVHRHEIASSGDKIRLAPGIYQQYVEKQFELRITIVGRKIFACRIDSQKDEVTQIDWRRDQQRDMYLPFELSVSDRAKLQDLHMRLGLHYAAYDYIVDLNGQLVFLECNPGGQWLWIENATGLPIAEAMIDDLSAAVVAGMEVTK